MQQLEKNTLLGALLVIGGTLFLLANLGILGSVGALFWALVFGAGGLAFIFLFLTRRHDGWWAAIPGFTLLGLMMTILVSEVIPGLDALAGPLFLAAIGMGFASVFVVAPRNWWALIPAGFLVTLAAVAGVDGVLENNGLYLVDPGAIFFLGGGLTFLLLALLPNRTENLRWAYFPAAILLAIGAVVAIASSTVLAAVWPLALIAGGLFMLLRNREWGKRMGDHGTHS